MGLDFGVTHKPGKIRIRLLERFPRPGTHCGTTIFIFIGGSCFPGHSAKVEGVPLQKEL